MTADPHGCTKSGAPTESDSPSSHRRQNQVRLTVEQVEDLVATYRQGTSVPEVASVFGVHRTTVLLQLERNGVDRRLATRKLSDADVAEAAVAYDSGDSPATIGARLGVNASTGAWASDSLSLSGFRGGPVFPAMFIGAASGIALSHLPGLPLVSGAAMGIGAMSIAMLGLPMVSTLLVALFLQTEGLALMPTVIVAVVVSYVVSAWIRPAAPSAPPAPMPAPTSAPPATT